MLAEAADVEERVADALANRLVYAGLVERHSPEPSAGSLYLVQDRVHDYARLRATLEDSSELREARLARVRQARSVRLETRADKHVRQVVFPLMMAGSLWSALARARASLGLARELGDADAENSARAVIAELTAELGNVSEALTMAQDALVAAEPSTKARAYRCLGHAHRRLYRLDAASAAFEEARHLALVAEDKGEEVRTIVQQAVVAALRGDFAVSAAECDEAERICLSRGPAGSSQLALVLLARGRTLHLAGEADRAYQVLIQGRTVASAEDQLLRCAHMIYYTADVLLQQGKLPDAEQRAAQARDDFAKMQHSYGAARCRLLLGRIAYRGGRFEESAQILQEALETFHGCGDPLIEAEALLELSRSCRVRGESDQAARLRGRAIEMFIELDYAAGVALAMSDVPSDIPSGDRERAGPVRNRSMARGR